jgi:hypothetical protein
VITLNCTEVPDPKSIYRCILEKSSRYSGGSLANAEKELESLLSDGPMTYVSCFVLHASKHYFLS